LACGGGCESEQAYQQRQRQQKLAAQGREWLLAKYPLGQTTRAEIQKTFVRPTLACTRPSRGWNALSNQWLRGKVSRSEALTGKSVLHVDYYFGPVGARGDPGFASFFFGDDDRLTDAD